MTASEQLLRNDEPAPKRSHSLVARLLARSRVWLRATGLDIARAFYFRDTPEEPKVFMATDRTVAFQRAFVRVLPAVVSVFIVSWNYCGYFIGKDLQGISHETFGNGLLQVSAKLHVGSRSLCSTFTLTKAWFRVYMYMADTSQELLVVGSLSAVIIHFIRRELAFGRGIPLGLAVSGWRFTALR